MVRIIVLPLSIYAIYWGYGKYKSKLPADDQNQNDETLPIDDPSKKNNNSDKDPYNDNNQLINFLCFLTDKIPNKVKLSMHGLRDPFSKAMTKTYKDWINMEYFQKIDNDLKFFYNDPSAIVFNFDRKNKKLTDKTSNEIIPQDMKNHPKRNEILQGEMHMLKEISSIKNLDPIVINVFKNQGFSDKEIEDMRKKVL